MTSGGAGQEMWFYLADDLAFEAFRRGVEARYFPRDIQVERHGEEAHVTVHDRFTDLERLGISAIYERVRDG